jgi:hypothetical protein
MLYKRLEIKIQMWYFVQLALKKALKNKVQLTGWLWGYTVVGIPSY